MALLPDPMPRERQHILISVDDHVIEPPDMFEGRLPKKLADRAPKIVETASAAMRSDCAPRTAPSAATYARLAST